MSKNESDEERFALEVWDKQLRKERKTILRKK